VLYYNENQLTKALEIFLKVFELNPQNKDAAYNISYLFDQFGEHEMASTYLELSK
jgi:tetratricopeptide (TPR) repeat protein